MTIDDLYNDGFTIKSGAVIYDNRNGFDEVLLLYNFKRKGHNSKQRVFLCHGRQGEYTRPILLDNQTIIAQTMEA
jgi:hypothetical protein